MPDYNLYNASNKSSDNLLGLQIQCVFKEAWQVQCERKLTWLRLGEDLFESVIAKVSHNRQKEEACAYLAQVDTPRHMPVAIS